MVGGCDFQAEVVVMIASTYFISALVTFFIPVVSEPPFAGKDWHLKPSNFC